MPVGIYKRPSSIDRFWKYVKIGNNDECWEWIGGINSTGRGIFGLDGKSIHAHRYAYIIEHGEIPAGKFVCHKCDNGKCVNPNHLFLGDALINNRDCFAKGRHPILRGENDPKSKLNNQKALEIVDLYKTGKYSQYDIALMFGISRSTVLNVLRGVAWGEATGIVEPLNLFAKDKASHYRKLKIIKGLA